MKEITSSAFCDLSHLEHVLIDLKYASTDNFLGENLYGSFDKALLHPDAFYKLKRATELLQMKRPRYKFIIYDALRPFHIHLKLFAKVEGTPQEIYVAHPKRKSVHNFGMAVDLSLLDEQGRLLDMGTGFDAFEDASQPQLEEKFFKEGRLTQEHLDNRRLLRGIMEESGFIQLPHEWWHFDAAHGDEVRARYDIFE